MKTVFLNEENQELSFSQAKILANDTADSQLEEPVMLSWYDQVRDMESPSGVSECHQDCDIPGCVEYAQSRGGALIVNIANGKYLFCYRELGEFA